MKLCYSCFYSLRLRLGFQVSHFTSHPIQFPFIILSKSVSCCVLLTPFLFHFYRGVADDIVWVSIRSTSLEILLYLEIKTSYSQYSCQLLASTEKFEYDNLSNIIIDKFLFIHDFPHQNTSFCSNIQGICSLLS